MSTIIALDLDVKADVFEGLRDGRPSDLFVVADCDGLAYERYVDIRSGYVEIVAQSCLDSEDAAWAVEVVDNKV